MVRNFYFKTLCKLLDNFGVFYIHFVGFLSVKTDYKLIEKTRAKILKKKQRNCAMQEMY